MSSYNQYSNSNQGITSNFTNINSSIENKGFFSRILRDLSNLGMNFDDQLIRNQIGVGLNEDPYSSQGNSMYDFFSSRAIASVLNRKSIPYLDKSYSDKRRILREYSIKDEIRDFVTSIADETIIYNDDSDFCFPKKLSNDYSEEIINRFQEVFETIYNRYGFSDNITAWTMLKDFLIDGYLSIEIIYDDKKKNIIGFNRISPETVVPTYEPTIGNLWIQYPEDPQLRRIFLDSQFIFISYSSQNEYSETSYLEGLIKPYNQLKIIEQTRIMFNLINATVYQKFVVPIKGLGRTRAEEQIGQLIHDYSEEIEWDETTGILTINGVKKLNYNKQIWFPEGDGGTPTMELVSPEGHNLNESDMLTWFYNALKRASKIPFGRFDKDNGGGSLFNDTTEMTRDEIKFSSFINRLRANFKEIIVKPLKLQMLIDFPELKNDEVFLNRIDISFNSNQLFEEWKKINNLSKRAEIFGSLSGIMLGETPYFHPEYLIDYVFRLSEEEKSENQKYWAKEPNPGAASGGEAQSGGGEDSGFVSDAEATSEMPGEPLNEPTEGGGAQGGGGEFEF
jgi:hypothetical protein